MPKLARACLSVLIMTSAVTCSGRRADQRAPIPSSMLLPESLPLSKGNRFADSLPAARLGYQVFYDARFSQDGKVRCASCHLPERHFHDGLAVAIGKGGKPLPRNTPSIFTAAWNPGDFMWDGRADSLWSQPLLAFENPGEMGTTRLQLARALRDSRIYRPLYEDIFGPLPDLADTRRFPPRGRPGDEAFDNMSAEDQGAINLVVANLGKALEAYMRKVATGRAAFDRYLLGDMSAISEAAVRGLDVFVSAGCPTCHSGPTFTDGLYYDVHVPQRPDVPIDRAHARGLEILAASPFNHLGVYYDHAGGDNGGGDNRPVPPPGAADERAFRTPSLRDLERTAPYMHNGVYQSIAQVLEGHGPQNLSAGERLDLEVFLLSLSGRYPERPWDNWPNN